MNALISTPAPAEVVADSRVVLAQHARSFNLAGKFLPRARRDEAAVVYAVCRLVDDLADEAPSPRRARIALDEVRRELHDPAIRRPLIRAFVDVMERTGTPLAPAFDLLDGVTSDLLPVRVLDDGGLIRYGYRVAGTVGLMMSGVIGVRERAESAAFAIDLGIAMQITNICRDVAEDAARGRIYLPASRLDAAGVDATALLRGDADRARVGTVVADLLALADRYYESGLYGARYIPTRTRLAIATAAHVYRAIGDEIAARGHDVLPGRTVAPRWRKARAIATAAWSTVTAPRVPARAHDAALHRGLEGLGLPAPHVVQ